MSNPQSDSLLQVETTRGSLLHEIQIIWDEVGEPDNERDKMLLELEQECLEVYRRKVDQANKRRAQVRQEIAHARAELATICATLVERPRQFDLSTGSLKEELRSILPELEEMQKRKGKRKKQFLEVLDEIQKVSNELYRSTGHTTFKTAVDETDLSLRKLEELHRQLQAILKEKSERQKQVSDLLHTMDSLCSVLGMDFKQTASKVHPSLGDSEVTNDISNDTTERLMSATKQLREVKIQRMQKLQDLATNILVLWNLMDTSMEEQQNFQNFTSNIAASEDEITEPNRLSLDSINYVEAEVSRLEELKTSKMKELVLKKKTELEEICRKTHMVLDTDSTMEHAIEAIESGTSSDPAHILEQIEHQTSKVKEEAFSRKEILEKVEKWMSACEEESWLEEYNRDEKRYNAGRGTHLTLKRAEKARSLVTKLPAMEEALASKVTSWETERGAEFTYDGIRLLSMLEEHAISRQEKEQERRRQRDQKRLQGQLIAEQEVLFGSKPSPTKPQNVKKSPKVSTGARRGLDKLHSFNASNAPDIHSPKSRVPLSPISSTSSSKANMPNSSEDAKNMQFETFQKALPNIDVPTSTRKEVSSSVPDEENRTPKSKPISTPSTESNPMQTVPFGSSALEEVSEEFEYSFEERRAGFVLPEAQIE